MQDAPQAVASQPTLVFLGSSGAIQVPSFHCTCNVCQAAAPIHRTAAPAHWSPSLAMRPR